MEREFSYWHICQIPTRNVLLCDDIPNVIVIEEYEVTETCYSIISVLPVNKPYNVKFYNEYSL